MAIKDTARRWGARGYGALNLWAVLPQSVVAVITAWASTGVHWMRDLGWFGIIMSGLIGYAVTAFGRAQTARMRVLRVEAKARELVAGESSPFDPMAHVYEGKRLYLRDLAPAGRRNIANKRFIDCEIIGPGVVMIGMQTDPNKPGLMRNSHTMDGVDVFEIDQTKESQQAIKFWDCDFDGCKFYHMSMLFTGRQNEGLHWITKDSRQALLPDVGMAALIDQSERRPDVEHR
jgi:hypothetical protein